MATLSIRHFGALLWVKCQGELSNPKDRHGVMHAVTSLKRWPLRSCYSTSLRVDTDIGQEFENDGRISSCTVSTKSQHMQSFQIFVCAKILWVTSTTKLRENKAHANFSGNMVPFMNTCTECANTLHTSNSTVQCMHNVYTHLCMKIFNHTCTCVTYGAQVSSCIIAVR